MTRSSLLLNVSAVILSLAGTARAQTQADPRDLMKELADKYKRLTTYYFDFTIVTDTKTEAPRSKTNMIVEQSFALAENRATPSRSFAEIGSPLGPLTVISDGKVRWTFAPQDKQFTKEVIGAPAKAKDEAPSDVTGLPGIAGMDMARIFSMQATSTLAELGTVSDRIKVARYLPEEKLSFDGEKVDVLVVEVEYAQNSRSTLWIDKARHLILRKVDQETSKNVSGSLSTVTTTTNFNRIQFNEPVPDDLFVFHPPADAKEVKQIELRAALKQEPASDLSGKEAPDFTLKDVAGKDVNLQKLRGKVVVLDFWATWCGPCLIELPHIEKLHKELNDVVFLGIDDEEVSVVQKFMKEKGYTFSSLVDADEEIAHRYNIEAIPQTIVIDKTGKVVAHYIGDKTENELREGLGKAGIARASSSMTSSGASSMAKASVSPAVRTENGEKAFPLIEAQPLTRVDAAYPANQEATSATVQVLVTISAGGSVVEAQAISGPPLFQESAVKAARQWTFKPLERAGKPVGGAAVLTFSFKPPTQ